MVYGVTLLWGCNKTVKPEISTLFYYPRAFPSSKLLPCCWRLWDMRIPLNQPSFSRKWQLLQLSGGSVWVRSSSGEPHAPDKASSLRFSCSLCGSQTQEPWWPQVSKHTENRLSMPLWCCLCRTVIYFIGAPFMQHNTSIKLVSKSKTLHLYWLKCLSSWGPAYKISKVSIDSL